MKLTGICSRTLTQHLVAIIVEGLSKPVSHISQTITSLNGSALSLRFFAARFIPAVFLCPLAAFVHRLRRSLPDAFFQTFALRVVIFDQTACGATWMLR